MFINVRIPRRVLFLGGIFLLLVFLYGGGQLVKAAKVAGLKPVEQVPTQEKAVALTMNVDWGEEYIPDVLRTLEKRDTKITFFVTGRWAKKNPELLKQIAAAGHEIENHGYSHPHPDRLSVAANQEEIKKTESIIRGITGRTTAYYAPPYGERGLSGLKAAQELGYTTILWTLDTVDWRPDSTPQSIAGRVLYPGKQSGRVPDQRGAIVLMHPKENTLKALPMIIDKLKRDGFRLITVDELITLNRAGNTTSE